MLDSCFGLVIRNELSSVLDEWQTQRKPGTQSRGSNSAVLEPMAFTSYNSNIAGLP